MTQLGSNISVINASDAKSDVDELTISFNCVAEKTIFDDDGVKGVNFFIHKNEVSFKPAFRRTENTFLLSERSRGGLQVDIKGGAAQELYDALSRMSSNKKPFFRIDYNGKSGYSLQHYDEEKSPNRHRPWLRVKFPRDNSSRNRLSEVDPDFLKDVGEWGQTFIKAAHTVSDYEKSNKVGRPSQDVVKAKLYLDQFRILVDIIFPQRTDSIKKIIGPMQELQTQIGALLGDMMKATTVSSKSADSVWEDHDDMKPAADHTDEDSYTVLKSQNRSEEHTSAPQSWLQFRFEPKPQRPRQQRFAA